MGARSPLSEATLGKSPMSDVERKTTPNFPFIIPKMQQPSSKHHALVARQDDERGKSGVGLGDASW
jgi:hypothetical protein